MLGDISVVTELYVVCGYTDQIILLPCTCSVESGVTGSRHFCTSRMGSFCFTKDLMHMSADTSGRVIKTR